MNRGHSSTRPARLFPPALAFAVLVGLSVCEFWFFVATAMPLLVHAVASVVLAGFAWRLFATPTGRKRDAESCSSERGDRRSPVTGGVEKWPDALTTAFYGIFGGV